MNPQMQQLAANRMELAANRMGGGGYASRAENPISQLQRTGSQGSPSNIDGFGMGSALSFDRDREFNALRNGGIMALGGGPPGSQPAPGVTGITPGAVERRVGNPTPPSMQLGSNARFDRSAAPMAINPNQQGPARGELNAPVGNIENFLRNLQNRRSQQE